MFKFWGIWLIVFISVMLFTLVPVQAASDQDDALPDVLSSSISENIIAYKGVQHPGYTKIKFETNKPVQAYLKISGGNIGNKIELSNWLEKESKYELNFVPMNYEKAYFKQYEALPPGKYHLSVEIVDESYNRTYKGLGSIEIVQEGQELPLVELLDIKITNGMNASKIEPKMTFQYKVNRPAYIQTPVFWKYTKDYLQGERTEVSDLPVESQVKAPGIYEVEWDLKPHAMLYLYPLDYKGILNPGEYKILFKSMEESIINYTTLQSPFDEVINSDELINSEEIDILITSIGNDTEIKILEGWTPPFDDIRGHWSEDNILFLSSEKIINGVGNNEFRPNDNITRAQYISMILKALDLNFEAKDSSGFTDIKPNAWYHDTVETALELGLVTGYEDHTFRPDNPVTRQEMAAIAVRASHYKIAKQPGSDEIDLSMLDNYNDKNSISSWARNSVAIAANQGLLRGRANNLFEPNGISTRAEGAAVVKRLYDSIKASI